MSFIGGLFSGSQGANWQPEMAATTEQAQELYKQQQDAIARQRQFAQALAAQSPEAIKAQQQLLGQLQGRAAGTGPSVAQSQLAQATGQGIAGVGAALAGQRGSGANVGLTQRNIAGMGAQSMQDLAGRAATLRAQEQMGAEQSLMGLAGQQLSQVQAARQQELQAGQAQQAQIQQAIANRNQLMQAMAGGKQEFQAGLIGGLLGAGATAVKGMAKGGSVEKDDEKKEDFASAFSKNMESMSQPQSRMAQAGKMAGSSIGGFASQLMAKKPKILGATKGGYSGANLGLATEMPQMINPMATSQNIGALNLGMAKGGKVPAMVSPGEKYLPPSEVEKVKKGEKEPVNAGRMIPGKARVAGDSLKNDTVPATLEEGGIVIPRSVMQSENPAEKARQFVAAVIAKQKMKRK